MKKTIKGIILKIFQDEKKSSKSGVVLLDEAKMVKKLQKLDKIFVVDLKKHKKE